MLAISTVPRASSAQTVTLGAKETTITFAKNTFGAATFMLGGSIVTEGSYVVTDAWTARVDIIPGGNDWGTVQATTRIPIHVTGGTPYGAYMVTMVGSYRSMANAGTSGTGTQASANIATSASNYNTGVQQNGSSNGPIGTGAAPAVDNSIIVVRVALDGNGNGTVNWADAAVDGGVLVTKSGFFGSNFGQVSVEFIDYTGS